MQGASSLSEYVLRHVGMGRTFLRRGVGSFLGGAAQVFEGPKLRLEESRHHIQGVPQVFSFVSRPGSAFLDEDHDGQPGVNPAYTSAIGMVKFSTGLWLVVAHRSGGGHCASRLAWRGTLSIPICLLPT